MPDVWVYLCWKISGELVHPCRHKVNGRDCLFQFYVDLADGRYKGVPRRHLCEGRYKLFLAGRLLTVEGDMVKNAAQLGIVDGTELSIVFDPSDPFVAFRIPC